MAEEKRKEKKMCKYASTGVFEVKSKDQLEIINKVISQDVVRPHNKEQQTAFNSNLWGDAKSCSHKRLDRGRRRR